MASAIMEVVKVSLGIYSVDVFSFSSSLCEMF
jgi:hypothetical protein